MKTRVIIITIAVLCLQNTSTFAATFGSGAAATALEDKLDSLTIAPVWHDTSIDVYNGEVPDLLDSHWMNTATGSVSTFLFELADYAPTNTFGIYDATDENVWLEIFDGDDTAGAVRTVYVAGDGRIWLDSYSPGDTADADFASPLYGFYLDATDGANGGLWYSDTDLNSDDMDHMYAYQGVGDKMDLPDPWNDNTVIGETYYILAWEDLDASVADKDFTDMAVLVESIRPIPVPAAVLLGILGLGVAGLKLRKYA